MRAQAGQIDEAVNRAQQVIGWDMTLDVELVEQRASCITVRAPIILPPSSSQARLNQHLQPAATSTFATLSIHSGCSQAKRFPSRATMVLTRRLAIGLGQCKERHRTGGFMIWLRGQHCSGKWPVFAFIIWE
jgi:hypothetical protein